MAAVAAKRTIGFVGRTTETGRIEPVHCIRSIAEYCRPYECRQTHINASTHPSSSLSRSFGTATRTATDAGSLALRHARLDVTGGGSGIDAALPLIDRISS